jgi:transposase
MTILSETIDAVIGGDTHRDTHALEMCSPTGATIATLEISNTDAGFADALAWTHEHAPGPNVVVALEGTRSFGIGLARSMTAAGMRVVEACQPRNANRRGKGKTDPIDAHLAAVSALNMDMKTLSVPRADGSREALRILSVARHEMTNTQTRHINQLRALLRGGDDSERELARGSLPNTRLGEIARRRGHSSDGVEKVVRRAEARRLALAIKASRIALVQNKEQLAELVEQTAPGLTDGFGIGPVSAAQVIVSWSHPGRCRNEAAFASLAGVCPIPASSGRTIRHRLNRGGDRALNRALHDILSSRWRACARTHAYIEKRRSEGKTDKEIRRCLKRYIARELHHTLTRTMTEPQVEDNLNAVTR